MSENTMKFEESLDDLVANALQAGVGYPDLLSVLELKIISIRDASQETHEVQGSDILP